MADPVEAIVRYHRRSTHHAGRFAPGPGYLDWANQPDPFRRYDGAPAVELPLAGGELGASWDDLGRRDGAPERLDRASLGAFLELSLGITAWKEAGASRWALRANPSSGNLHPTEGYVLVPERPGMPAGLYHYRPIDHAVERRAGLDGAAGDRLSQILPEDGFLVGVASIHWREAWKYGERAFRYCQHDAGHALATLRYAAAVLGWHARLLASPGDDDVAALLGLDRDDDHRGLAPADRERPEALVLVSPRPPGERDLDGVDGALDELAGLVARGTWAGRPNELSRDHVSWPEIDVAAEAARKPRTVEEGDRAGEGGALPGVTGASTRAVELIRQRRSAVAMDGRTAVRDDVFFETMGRLLPRARVPWDVLPWAPRVHPVLFVHRVGGLAPGLYVLAREPAAEAILRTAFRPGLLWERPSEAARRDLPLFLLEEGDTRSFARFASCQQAIASESAYSLGMLGVFEDNLASGAFWYRRLFWEAGILGQVLYMEAEARGRRGTGIGCYFDDVVHEVLGVGDQRLRDLYHFTVGGAVEDTRLATQPAYPPGVGGRT